MPSADLQLVVTRLLNAPRALVFEALTDPRHLAHWWGPFGFRLTTHEHRAEVGGTWRSTMHGPDGRDYPSLASYREVVKHERLTYHHGAGRPGEPGFEVVITLADEGGKTRLTLTQTYPTPEAAAAARGFALEGGNQTFTRLDGYLQAMRGALSPALLEGSDPSGEDDFVISRVFAAPRALVYRVMTEPEHLGRWFGPAGMTLKVVQADVRVGGTFRYSMEAGGRAMFGRFVFRELTPVERFAYVVSFTDAQGTPVRHPMAPTWPLEVLAVNSLAEHGDQTLFVGRSLPLRADAQERQTFHGGHDGMVKGFKGTYDQLDAYLRTLR